MQLLNQIVVEYNPIIILSSYWRTRYSLEEINKIFKKHGFVGKISDKTDEQGEEHSERWNQIKRYIKKNNVKNFIILDDEKISENEVSPNFIKTNSYNGLRKKHLNLIGYIWN